MKKKSSVESIQLNKQRVLDRRHLQSERLKERAIRLERMRQRASTCNSVETEEEIQERTNRLADLSQRANVRVSEKTCDEMSHRLQVMSDFERVRRSNESGTYYIINLEPVLFLFLHHQ